jgi:hypothetical protein
MSKKIAFVSPHCVIDSSNGAATATLEGLQFLQTRGFAGEAFCGTRLDVAQEALVEEVLAQQRLRYEVRNAHVGPHRARMIFTVQGKLPVTLFNTASTRGGWLSGAEAAAFLTACEVFLARNRRDLIWTYGGDGTPTTQASRAVPDTVDGRGKGVRTICLLRAAPCSPAAMPRPFGRISRSGV